MLDFNEDKHEYTLDGKKLISVTQLMQKHGLAPNYDAVPEKVLRAAAERGSFVHKEIEDFNKHKEIGFSKELENYINYVKENNVEVQGSEFMVNNDIVAGTVDLALVKDGVWIIADIKTTSTLHTDAVSWQLSIYRQLIPNIPFKYGQAFHFSKDGSLNVVDIPLKPIEEVKKLFECERNGLLYAPTNELSGFDYELSEIANAEEVIKQYEELKKIAEEQTKAMRDALMAAMEAKGIKTFENDKIKLTYVASTTRSSIDSTKLKKEMPEIAAKYEKVSNVKASLKISLKEEQK